MGNILNPNKKNFFINLVQAKDFRVLVDKTDFSFFCIKCGWVGALTPTLGMARVVSPGLFAWGWGRAPTPRQSVN